MYADSVPLYDVDWPLHEIDPGKGKLAVADIDGDGLNDIIQRGDMYESLVIHLAESGGNFQSTYCLEM